MQRKYSFRSAFNQQHSDRDSKRKHLLSGNGFCGIRLQPCFPSHRSDREYAYVANDGCANNNYAGTVSRYFINLTSGVLTSAGPPVNTEDEGADSVAVDPTGRFVYVANWGQGDTAGSVSMYTLNAANGALSSIGTASAPCLITPGSCAPWSLAIDPAGKFVFVANEGGLSPTSVSSYAINPATGGLTITAIMAVDGRASVVDVDPSGQFAYVADGGKDSSGTKGSNISMFQIDATTGGLPSIGHIVTGTSPQSMAIHPSGKFAYAVNYDSNNISMYTLDSTTGNLTSIGTVAGPAGSIVIHPSGKFAYIAGSGGVSMYTINTATGVLAPAGTTGVGSSPSSISIHPTGKFAYGTNPTSNNVSMYSIDVASGSLTLIGTIGI